MAMHPVLTLRDGKLEIPENMQRDLHLSEGSELKVVTSKPGLIVLESQRSIEAMGAIARMDALFEQMRANNPDRRTPEWKAAAIARRQAASDALERLYQSGTATTNELGQAEREWEFADDELDFGPFRER